MGAIQSLIGCLNRIYETIKLIETMKQKHLESTKNMAPTMKRISTAGIGHLSPTISRRRSSLFPQNEPGFNRMSTTQPIMQNILQFGLKYHDKNDYIDNQFISDQELAELYDVSDWKKDLREAMYTKIFEYSSEMKAAQFQLNEYLQYIQHFQSTKKGAKMRKCEDPNCEWDADKVKLWSLSQRQVVHVMMYHTEDYDKIATSETRA